MLNLHPLFLNNDDFRRRFRVQGYSLLGRCQIKLQMNHEDFCDTLEEPSKVILALDFHFLMLHWALESTVGF